MNWVKPIGHLGLTRQPLYGRDTRTLLACMNMTSRHSSSSSHRCWPAINSDVRAGGGWKGGPSKGGGLAMAMPT